MVAKFFQTDSETFLLADFFETGSETFLVPNIFETGFETFLVPNFSYAGSDIIKKNEKFPGTGIPGTGTSNSALYRLGYLQRLVLLPGVTTSKQETGSKEADRCLPSSSCSDLPLTRLARLLSKNSFRWSPTKLLGRDMVRGITSARSLDYKLFMVLTTAAAGEEEGGIV